MRQCQAGLMVGGQTLQMCTGCVQAARGQGDLSGRLPWSGRGWVGWGLAGSVFFRSSLWEHPLGATVYFDLCAVGLLACAARFYGSLIATKMPSRAILLRWAYQNGLWSYVLMTMHLVSHSLWSYDAWGRPWWVGSEMVSSLIAWLVFSGYFLFGR